MPEEGTASTFAGLLEVFTAQGLPCRLYTDRGSHYFHTPAVAGRVSRVVQTQVGPVGVADITPGDRFAMALAQLGIERIAAYSPEARGRSERAVRTLQDRLPRGWRGRESRRLRRRTPGCGRPTCPSTMPGSAFASVPGVDLDEVLCRQEERQVGLGPDNTMVLHKVRLQIPASPLRAHYVRASVKVRRYPDGSHAVFHGPRCIGRYDATGLSLDLPRKQAA